MDFIDSFRQLAAPIPKQLEHIHTEEATKIALVTPFIRALGYDTTDPAEVVPEFTADVGEKKGEKVDFAIMISRKPAILFECKWSGSDLDQEHASQLRRYLNSTEARFGVLTNGVVYRFFADLEKPNVMDSRPFLEFNMLDIQEDLVEELKKFTKESFDLDDILTTASELKYTREIKRLLSEELSEPSDEFVRFFGRKVYTGMMTQSVREQFAQITRSAFHQVVNDRISERLRSALSDDVAPPSEVLPEGDQVAIVAEGEEDDTASDIVTTDEELEGYYIVKSILREGIDIARVIMRDQVSYCSIILDNNQFKNICRLRFNSSQKYLGVLDEEGNEQRLRIVDLDGIYAHADRLKGRVAFLDSKYQVGSARPRESSA